MDINGLYKIAVLQLDIDILQRLVRCNREMPEYKTKIYAKDVFCSARLKYFVSKSNRVLYSKKQGHLQSDDFDHEQSLILTVNGQSVLVSGCSHAGIVNIVNKAESLIPTEITTVIGGFHLYNPPTKKYESNEMIDTIAVALAKKNFIYYTCHCTGMQAYKRMKEMLGKELHYLSTGTVVML